MMKKFTLIFLTFSGLLVSCKKSSPAPTATSTNSSSNPYCFLTALRSYSYYAGSLTFDNNYAYAEFRSDVNNISTDMQVGSVAVGGKFLKYQPATKTYADTTNSISIVPTTWQIAGAGPVPSFTFTNNDSLPTYTGYTSLPDTIYKNQTLNLQVNGVSGADNIDVSIYNSSTSSVIYKTKAPVSSNNTVTFSTTDLSTLLSGNTSLVVSIFKHNYQHSGNVTYSFATQYEINKQVYIK